MNVYQYTIVFVSFFPRSRIRLSEFDYTDDNVFMGIELRVAMMILNVKTHVQIGLIVMSKKQTCRIDFIPLFSTLIKINSDLTFSLQYTDVMKSASPFILS